jgi:2-methylcitrate dehydratase PrpD
MVNRELMSRVKIEEKSGKFYQKTIRIPKGDPRNPMTQDELFEKFKTLAGPVIGAKNCEKVCHMVMEKLEHIESVRNLTDLLYPQDA